MEKGKNRLCVLIPTMNRAKCIEEVLRNALPDIERCNVDFFIYDTSNNQETKKLVEAYDASSRDHIFYYFHESYPDKTTDFKIINAFKMLQDKYEYIWLSGDGCILKITEMLSIVQKYLERHYEVIHFTGEDKNNVPVIEEYNQAIDLFADHGPFMTYYSATILSTDFIKRVPWEAIGQEYRNTGFLFWKGIFEGLASEIHKMVVVNRKYLNVNPNKNGNSSCGPGKFLKFWACNWPKTVYSLPSYYDKYKKSVCISLGEQQKFYDMENLIRLRKTNNLNEELFEKYKDGLSVVTNASLKKIHFVATMPSWLVYVFRALFYVKYNLILK